MLIYQNRAGYAIWETWGTEMLNAIGGRRELDMSDFTEPTLFVKLGKELTLEKARKPGVRPYDLYERVRGEWALSLECARTFGLVLAVCEGEVVEAYRVVGWFRAGETMHHKHTFTPNEGRVEFVGSLAEDAVRQRFVGRSMRDIFTGSNPVRYIEP